MEITKDIRYVGVNDHAVTCLKASTRFRAACPTILMSFSIKR